MAQTSKVSGIVQIDGRPVKRTVRAFSYDSVAYDTDGAPVLSSKSLGESVSDEANGNYEIDLLGGYGERVFVVAFDDYGRPFSSQSEVFVGDRVHPSTPNGYVFECIGAGTLPENEPDWIANTETAQLYGTASMIAKPFYRPMVHGPVTPSITQAPGGTQESLLSTLSKFKPILLWPLLEAAPPYIDIIRGFEINCPLGVPADDQPLCAGSTKSLNFSGNAYGLAPFAAFQQFMSFSWVFWIKTADTENTVVFECNENDGFSVQMGIPNAKYGGAGPGSIGITGRFGSSDSQKIIVPSNTAINDNAPHMVAITVLDKTIKVYVDGVFDRQQTLNTSVAPVYENDDICIGSRKGEGPAAASIDFLTCYPTELTADQVAEIYAAGLIA